MAHVDQLSHYAALLQTRQKARRRDVLIAGGIFLPFLLYTALGAAIWSGVLAYGGMVLGEQYERITQLLRQADVILAVLLLLAVARWIIQRFRQRRSGR